MIGPLALNDEAPNCVKARRSLPQRRWVRKRAWMPESVMRLEHESEKRIPVFRKDHAPLKI
jgi:hypothetical protein